MSGFTKAIITGITSFVATNIDDIVILMIFFAQLSPTFRRRHIVLGQYLGFTALVLASLPGFFGGLVIPKEWIGLLGIVPILVGVSQLFKREQDKAEVQTVTSDRPTTRPTWLSSLMSPQTYSVAAVTIANGGDNISVYVSLFASSSLTSLIVILIVFFLLVGIWCFVAYQLTRQPAIAQVLTRYGHAIVPFVLIGLGIFILVDSGTYQLLFTRHSL
jgi:cadmium resistance transport/sequestration family protein